MVPSSPIEKPAMRPVVKPSCVSALAEKFTPNCVISVDGKVSGNASGVVAPFDSGIDTFMVEFADSRPLAPKFIVPSAALPLSTLPLAAPYTCQVLAAVLRKYTVSVLALPCESYTVIAVDEL